MKSIRGILYFIVCLLEYLILFFLEYTFTEFLAPLLFTGPVPILTYLPFLVLINPLLIWMTAESLMKRFGKELETK